LLLETLQRGNKPRRAKLYINRSIFFMKSILIILCSLVILSACNESDFVEILYFSRAKIVLDDADGEQNIYMCEKGDSEKETRQRAEEAHLYFQEEIKKIAKHFINNSNLITKEDKKLGIEVDGVDAAEKISKDTDKLMAELEAKFHCMFIGKVSPKD